MPIPLFRAGLGAVLGDRLLLIEHVGRTSGARRFVVVECIGRPSRNVVRVASGFGASAQWYRNIAANGVALLSIGRLRRIPATPRLLASREGKLRLDEYAARHPRAWRRLYDGMTAAQGGEPDIRVVEFRLDGA